MKYLLSTVLALYRDFEERVNIISAKFPDVEMARHIAYEKAGKFTKNDIMERCASLGKIPIENSHK